MRPSIPTYPVVALLCAFSLNYCLPKYTLHRRMVTKGVEDVASVAHTPSFADSSNHYISANRMLEDLQGKPSYRSGADNKKIEKLISQDVPESVELHGLQDFLNQYIAQDDAAEAIRGIQNKWHNVMSSIRSPLSDKEMKIKKQLEDILIETIKPHEFLKQNINDYEEMIDSITRADKWGLKQDPGQYFQVLIEQSQKDHHKLDELSRALGTTSGEVPDFRSTFSHYIVIEGLAEIMGEIRTAATSKFTDSLIRKTIDKSYPSLSPDNIDKDFQLHATYLKELYGSDDPQDVKWLHEQIFQKIRPQWLDPQDIIKKIMEDEVVPQELLDRLWLNSPVLKNWLTGLSKSKQLMDAVKDEDTFTKNLITKYMEDEPDVIADKYIEKSTSGEVLLRFAAQHEEKLQMRALGILKQQSFSPSAITRAMEVFDPEKIETYLASDTVKKDFAKAYIEFKMIRYHPPLNNPMNNFLEEVFPGTCLPMQFGIYSKLDDFDGRLFFLRDAPLQTGDSRLQGTLYEKMDEDIIQQVNNLAKTLHQDEPSYEQLSKAVKIQQEAPEVKRKLLVLLPEKKQLFAKFLHERLDPGAKSRFKKSFARIHLWFKKQTIRVFEVLAYYVKKAKTVFSKDKRNV